MGMQNGTSATLGDRLDTLSENLKHVVDHLSAFKGRAGEIKSHAASSASAYASKAGKAIKDHPFVAIGVAFGVGYLVMRLVRR